MTFDFPNLVKAAVPALVLSVPAATATQAPSDAAITYPKQLEQMGLGNVVSAAHETDVHVVTSNAVAASELTITVRKHGLALSLGEEKRFAALAAKEALGEISPAELLELEQLDQRRAATQRKLPVSAVEARERLFSKMDALLAELGKFGSQK